MQKIIDLADHVSRYNVVGKLKLPNLKIAIIQSKELSSVSDQIL